MDINVCIMQYKSVFSKSFYATAFKRYGVDFDSSVISDVRAKLEVLKTNIKDGIIRKKHNGLQITVTDVEIIVESLENIITFYKSYHKIKSIPSTLKDKDLIADVTNMILFQKVDNNASKIDELHKQFVIPKSNNLSNKQKSKIKADGLIANTNQSTRNKK